MQATVTLLVTCVLFTVRPTMGSDFDTQLQIDQLKRTVDALRSRAANQDLYQRYKAQGIIREGPKVRRQPQRRFYWPYSTRTRNAHTGTVYPVPIFPYTGPAKPEVIINQFCE